MSTLKRIVKNAGFVFVGDNALKILSMLLVFLIARYLGDVEYGKFSFVLSFTGLFFILMDLGTRILAVREIAENKENAQKIMSSLLALKIVTSVLVYLLIIAAAMLLGYEKMLIYGIAIAALGIVFDSFSITFDSLYQAYERMEYPSGLKIGRILIRFTITLPLLLIGAGFFQVLLAYVAVQFLNMLASAVVCFKKFIKPTFAIDLGYIGSLTKRAFPFLLSGIFVTIYFRIDVTLMSKIAPEILPGVYAESSRNAIIGWYSAAYNILDGLISVPIALSAAILPVAVMYYNKSKENLLRLYHLSVKYLTYLSLPTAFGITLLAPKLIVLIYKEQYANSILAIQILIWTIIPLYINYVLGAINIAIHKEKQAVIVLFLNTVLNITLNLILIPKWSLYGAAAATIITEVFYFTGYYYIISKNLKPINFLFVLKPFAASLIMSALIYLLLWMHVILLIIFGFFAYLISMLAMKAFSAEDMMMLKNIISLRKK